MPPGQVPPGQVPPGQVPSNPVPPRPAQLAGRAALVDYRRAIAALLDRPTESAFVAEFLAAVSRAEIDTDLLWLSEPTLVPITPGGPPLPRPPMAVLVLPGAGGAAMLFVTGAELPLLGQGDGCGRLSVGSEPSWLIEHRAQIIASACGQLFEANRAATAHGEIRMLQALLDPQQVALAASHAQAGFTKLAQLGYLRATLPRANSVPPAAAQSRKLASLAPGITVRSMADLGAQGDAHLTAALEQTYIQTADCPALCGLRRSSDVIASHRSVGHYDPTMWTIVYQNSLPSGCVLLSVCTDDGAVELVYLGLGPALRGRGLGRELLALAMQGLALGGQRTLACAVDLANAPALRMYQTAGFKRFAARDAFILPVHKQ